MKFMRPWLACLVAASAVAEEAPDPEFESKVKPVLRICANCHNETSRSSGFTVASRDGVIAGGARRGRAVVPGRPDDSILVQLLKGTAQPRMPLGGDPLPPDQIDAVAKWIRGLKASEPQTKAAEKWWAFQAPKRPSLPAVQDAGWVRNPIDRFILAQLERNSLKPAPEASRRILIRRLYFGLIGLPPASEEMNAALADSSPGSYEGLVDRLLADRRFGERWGRYWLDIARYADTDGFEGDMERPHMWRYRDYVIDSFNRDKRYDQFIEEQIAGDEMDRTNPEALIGAGFLRLAPWHPIGVTEEARQNLLNEMSASVGSIFLGLTLKCAQCHDHKYDPLTQKDFYRMQAFFIPVELAEVPAAFPDELRLRMEAAENKSAELLRAENERFRSYQQSLLPKLAGVLESEGVKPSLAKPALLEQRLLRNDAGTFTISADPNFNRAEKSRYLEFKLAVEPGSPRTLRDAGQLVRENARYRPLAHSVRHAGGTARTPTLPDAHVRIGGEYNRLGEAVTAGFPAILHESSDADAEVEPSRAHLAAWVASPENPLTARVMVNRIWQQVFGAGIVATPSDFGKNGAPPSHPELLDWLATEFVRNKWSIKSMIRLMLTSSVYRQSSTVVPEKAARLDPANRMLWRMNRKRLEAEAVRDSILAVSGTLNREAGGPGVFPPLPETLANIRIKEKPIWEVSPPSDTLRRSIYIFQRRQLQVPFLNVMDAPVPNDSCERRSVSTTATQALTLMNDPFVMEQVREFARRMEKTLGPDPREQVRGAFQLAFGRAPLPEETRKAIDLVREDGLEALCRVIVNSNEFLYVN